ncbi:MAG: hypothetical protein NUW06_08230 [Candidatus Acetothermia bacterium]|jgi:uncharacterized membrane protein YczE|nr:hypothetical protein [Candidatus Acetothermia bacterium]MDH7506095.1 hypothetical protein [Candidatus Acetothermia bacterium]
MEALLKAIVEKTGLPEAAAKTVIDMTFDYLSKKLRGPIGREQSASPPEERPAV